MFTPDGLIALVTLTVLEVVLGIDNVIFISILAGKLPPDQQDRARKIGLLAAMIMRLLLLMSLAWIIRLTDAARHRARPADLRARLILSAAGCSCSYKSTREIHEKLEGEEGHRSARVAPSLAAVVGQIMLLDIVFSLDSVITAVGMADQLSVMVTAVVLAVGIMFVSAASISRFVMEHPTVKVLALSFLLLIGCSLIADGFGAHIPKGYIYFAMGFSVFVEMINLRMTARKHQKAEPVKLHEPYT